MGYPTSIKRAAKGALWVLEGKDWTENGSRVSCGVGLLLQVL